MKIPRFTLQSLAAIAAGQLLLIACQNATEPSNGPSGNYLATGSFSMATSSRLPDFTRWKTPNDSGSQKPRCNGLDCSDTFRLSQPLGSDSLALELWTLGIRTTTIYFGEQGNSSVLDLKKKSFLRDILDTVLLSKYNTITSAQKASIYPLGQGSSELVAYYASLILAGDTAFVGKAAPVGMSVDSIKKDLVYLGNKAGLTMNQILAKNLGLGLDSTAVFKAVGNLINAKLFSSADSVAIFPCYPVRVTTPVSVVSFLTPGGNSVSLNGAFSWNQGKSGSVSFKVLAASKILDSTHFSVSQQKYIGSNDASWNLSNNAKLQAASDADTGVYTLVVTLSIDSSRSATSQSTFSVVAAPPGLPKIQRLSPANQTGNLLHFEADSFFVDWQVFNWKDIVTDSVFIGSGKATKLTDSTWGQKVFVPPSGQTTTIIFRVVGKNGEVASDYVLATRAKDIVGPVIEWVSPVISISVEATVSSAKVQVKVTDLSGVDSVYLQGLPARNDSGAYWSSLVALGLANGKPMPLVAKAWDKNRNSAVDSSIAITRNVPAGTDKPVLSILQPTSSVGNALVFDSATLHVVYRITDLVPLDTFSIRFGASVPKRLTDSTWAADVPIPATGAPFSILVVAANKNGSGSSDNVVVTRSKDLVNPIISKLLGTRTRTVGFDTASAVLSWTVSDNYKVWSVSLNSIPLTVAPVISQTVPLTVGTDSFFLVATDTFGNIARDTVVITRSPDIAGPTIHWVTPSIAWSVEASVATYKVQVTATDPQGVDSVYIQGQLAKHDSSSYWSSTVTLGQSNGLALNLIAKAWDKNRNPTVDSSVSITRKSPDGTDKPSLAIQHPSSILNNTLVFDSTTLHVAYTITDLVSLDASTIKFGGILARQLPDSTWVADIPIPPTGLPVSITVQAANKNGGGSTESIVVTRSKDQVNPTIVRAPSTKSRTVAFDTSRAVLSWVVSDNYKVWSITLNGNTVAVTPLVSQTVSLAIGADSFFLVATDSFGNFARDTVIITRTKDLVPPSVSINKPSSDTTVAYGTTSLIVTVKATDAGSGVMSIIVNGVPADPSGKATVSIGTGITLIKAIATDSAGNKDSATVAVNVAKDSAGPLLTIISPADGATLVYGTTSVSVSATASDGASGLATITIGSTVCKASPCTANFNLGLDNKVIVTAMDNVGLVSTRFVTVKIAPDNSFPVAVKGPTTKDTVVLKSVASIDVAWTVTDNAILSVTIGGAVPKVSGNVYSATVPLTSDDQWIKILAVDVSGHNTRDSIRVQRLSPPTLTAGGEFGSAQNVTITAPVGAIQYSTNGTNWNSYSGSISVSSTTTISARATLNGVNSVSASATYSINYNVSLATITVGGVQKTISGTSTTINWDSLSAFTANVVIKAVATDATNARVSLDVTSPVKLVDDATSVQITVTNGGISKLYTLNLFTSKVGTFSDSRGPTQYKAVKIGKRWWMAQNLNFPTSNSWCYDDNPANCSTYGRLYMWGDAMGQASDYAFTWVTEGLQGVCPDLWHMPTRGEWLQLATDVGSSGNGLKSKVSWDGTNASGFNALPGGAIARSNADGLGTVADFWSSTLDGTITPISAYAAQLNSGDNSFYMNGSSQIELVVYSVRCIKN